MKLISSQQLHQHLAEGMIDSQKPLLLEIGSGDLSAYKKAHIPGARYFDTGWIESPPMWNRIPDPELFRVFEENGLDRLRPTLVYSRNFAASTRAASIFFYAGVEKLSILDGGWKHWEQLGLPTETGRKLPEPAGAWSGDFPANPTNFVDLEEARRIRDDPESLLVSVRSWPEYIGESSGYEFIRRRGRIAGALWGQGGSDKDSMADYHNPDGTVRPLDEVASFWHERGITSDRRVVFYCGTGWRASEAFLYAHQMGWPRIAIYDGGWLEWSSDPENPVETGAP